MLARYGKSSAEAAVLCSSNGPFAPSAESSPLRDMTHISVPRISVGGIHASLFRVQLTRKIPLFLVSSTAAFLEADKLREQERERVGEPEGKDASPTLSKREAGVVRASYRCRQGKQTARGTASARSIRLPQTGQIDVPFCVAVAPQQLLLSIYCNSSIRPQRTHDAANFLAAGGCPHDGG